MASTESPPPRYAWILVFSPVPCEAPDAAAAADELPEEALLSDVPPSVPQAAVPAARSSAKAIAASLFVSFICTVLSA